MRLPVICLLGSLIFLSACTSLPDHAPPNQVFCGKFLFYSLCVEDLDVDGTVDIMYFTDTDEIFMRKPDFSAANLVERPYHVCVQDMDERVVDASSDLLYITDDTGFFQRAEIESNLLFQYGRYTGRINRCKKEHGLATEMSEEEFANYEDDFITETDNL